MKKTQRILQIQLLVAALLSIVIIILYETQLILPGTLFSNDESAKLTIVQFIMQFVTLAVCPIALYLFKIAPIRRNLTSPKALAIWGTLRIQMLCVPMVTNIWLYYSTGFSTGHFYMFLILGICLFLVYPSETRCKKELQ